MKIAITGHTSGIGLALYQALSQNHTVTGFARSTGHDIGLAQIRAQIASQCQDCDVFINNAYQNFDDSQLNMLDEIFGKWHGQDRLIINVGSRYTTDNNLYCRTKQRLDDYCRGRQYMLPRILNLKPGLVDTPRVNTVTGVRMTVQDIVTVVEFALAHRHRFNIHEIAWGL